MEKSNRQFENLYQVQVVRPLVQQRLRLRGQVRQVGVEDGGPDHGPGATPAASAVGGHGDAAAAGRGADLGHFFSCFSRRGKWQKDLHFFFSAPRYVVHGATDKRKKAVPPRLH